MNIEILTIHGGIYCGLLFTAILMPICYFSRKQALKKIQQNLKENEFIEVKFQHLFILKLFMNLMNGILFGDCTLDYLIHPQIQHLAFTTRSMLPFLFLINITLTVCLFLIFGSIIVITNLKIIHEFGDQIIPNFIKKLARILDGTGVIPLSDIKGYNYEFPLTLKLKNNKIYRLGAYQNKAQIEKVLISHNIMKIPNLEAPVF